MTFSTCHKHSGFSAIETIVAVAIFSIVFVALFASYKQALNLLSISEARSKMSAIAVEQFEIIRNLPYDKIGTVAGIPSGVIPQTKEVTKGNDKFTINTVIRNIDLPFDGLVPSDTSPADNKLAQIEIVCNTCRTRLSSSFTGQFGPKDLESSSLYGSLFIRTIDAAGNPVPDVTVKIKVNSSSTPVNLTDVTNNNGMLQLIGAVPLKNAYQVYVSKEGYTSDRTYSDSGPETTKPVIPYATVDQGTVTQLTFVIDKVSKLNVSSISPLCTPIPNVNFTLTGTKLIGYEPIYKFNKTFTTDNLGEYSISNFEWDTYTATTSKYGYDLIGIIPSPKFTVTPNSTQAIQLVMIPNGASSGQNKNTMMVSVKDGTSGAQLAGADVLFEHSLETINAITGRGQLIQTDWSNGGGQAMYEDIKSYFSDDGNVSVSASPGSVSLKKIGGGEYATQGVLTSSIIDTGLASNFYEFRFSPTSQPVGTDIKFQLATANATSGPFNFLGPDGTAATYYTKDNSIINAVNNGKRYIRYKMFLSTTDVNETPVVEDVIFYFTSSCMAPGQAYAQTIHNGDWKITISKSGYQTLTDHISIGGTEPWISKIYTLDLE